MVQLKFNLDTWFNTYSFLVLNLMACGWHHLCCLFRHAYKQPLAYLDGTAVLKQLNGRVLCCIFLYTCKQSLSYLDGTTPLTIKWAGPMKSLMVYRTVTCSATCTWCSWACSSDGVSHMGWPKGQQVTRDVKTVPVDMSSNAVTITRHSRTSPNNADWDGFFTAT